MNGLVRRKNEALLKRGASAAGAPAAVYKDQWRHAVLKYLKVVPYLYTRVISFLKSEYLKTE